MVFLEFANPACDFIFSIFLHAINLSKPPVSSRMTSGLVKRLWPGLAHAFGCRSRWRAAGSVGEQPVWRGWHGQAT